MGWAGKEVDDLRHCNLRTFGISGNWRDIRLALDIPAKVSFDLNNLLQCGKRWYKDDSFRFVCIVDRQNQPEPAQGVTERSAPNPTLAVGAQNFDSPCMFCGVLKQSRSLGPTTGGVPVAFW